MKMLPIAALTLALSLGGVASLQAQDAPAPPTTKPAGKPVKAGRVTGDYAKMGSLTAEQKSQIAAIHAQTLADKKAIDAKEEADIDALLSTEQKAELEKIREDEAAASKAKAKARKATPPATKPADAM